MSTLFNLFYIYDPWLFHFFRMAFFSGIIAIIFLVVKYNSKSLSNGIIFPIDSFLVIVGLILFSVIPLFINGTKELGVLLMYCKTLLLFIFGVGIYNLFYVDQLEVAKLRVIKDFKFGIGIQAIVGFMALMGISFVIDLALSTNVVMPRFYHSEQEYRLYNITSMAFFQLSAFYLVLLHFLLAYNQKYNTLSSLYLFLLLCIGLISGRSFLFLSVVSILIYFKWRYIPALLLFGIICLYLAIYCADNRYVQHALEPLINLLSHKGTISSSSDNLVKNHLYLPELKQILIGDGRYYTESGGYYGATDSGFIRQTLYGGISYVIVCFLFTAYFVKRIAENWFDNSWKFILSMLFILSVLNVKADTYAFPGIMLVLLMFLSLFGTSGKTKVLFQSKESI